MLIFGLGIVLLGLLVGSIIKIRKNRQSFDNEWWWVGVVASAIILLIIVVMVPCNYVGNMERVAGLKAFSEVNTQNYASAITETQAILSGQEFADKLLAGSLEKTAVGQSLSQRIVEWRDEVNKYNLEVAVMQRTRTIWLYPGFLLMPPEVNDLKLLTIE